MKPACWPPDRPTWAAAIVVFGAVAGPAAAEVAVNACPVDGCQIHFVSVEKAGDELKLTLEANFKPDMSKNHIHVWWGGNYDVKQVSNNAETVYGMKRGVWHPTDEFPIYLTQSGASMKERGKDTTLCVSAGDRNHDIIDPKLFECRSVADLVK